MLNDLTLHYQTKQPEFDPRLNGQAQQPFETLLKAADVVSFDMFDTLVQRENLFSPKDLFVRVQEEAARRLGLDLDDFTAIRVRAEEIARVRAWGRGIEETTLDEIYIELGRMMSLKNETIGDLKEIELNCERSALTALESGKRLFEAALAAGKTVIVVSDTYFDETFIGEILRQTGYDGIRKVYASSTYGKTKLEGSLYDLVLKDLRCTPNRLLHAGDNQLSDVTMALSKGVRALFLPTPRQRLRWRCGAGDRPSGSLALSRMLCEVSQKSIEVDRDSSDELQSVLAKTAVENLSLLYYAFAAWLLEQLRRGGYKRVYFAARDGLIMKRFFDLIADATGFEIDSRYLYISRASLYPSLIFTDPAAARRLFCQSWDHLTVEEALRRISLTPEDGGELLARYGLNGRYLELDSVTMPRFSAFLTEIWPLLEQKNIECYQLAVDYLQQEMVLTEGKAAVVDIGWHGSLQNCLIKLLDHLSIDKELDGYYLGTFRKPMGAAPSFKAKGFLVNNDEPQSISELIRFGPSVLELFHSAGHGSVFSYKRNGTQVVPVLEDNPVETKQFRQLIEPVQTLAFDFVAEQLEHISAGPVQLPDPELVTRMALRFIYAPTAAEATIFGHLKIASDFGGSMKSITGALEWDLKTISGETLPDGMLPIWRPGFHTLRNL